MNSKLALTLSYLNPALNNPAQKAGCSNHVRVSLIFVITNIYFQLSFTFPFNLVLFCFLFVVVVGGVAVVVVFFFLATQLSKLTAVHQKGPHFFTCKAVAFPLT